MATYYLDTEFDGHNGPLLSLALVRQDGISLYLQTSHEAQDPWVQENVIPIMDDHHAWAHFKVSDENEIGSLIRTFIKEDSFTIISDSAVDIGRFCQAINTSKDGNWEPTGYSAITFEVFNVDAYPTVVPGAVQHNSWWDAMALREKLYGG